ncbi:MAG: deoxyribonuclease V [Bacteroidota bacterium]
MKSSSFPENEDFRSYYRLQDEMRTSVIKEDVSPGLPSRVAGADVAYDEVSQKMFGALVVLDFQERKIVDQAWHVMDINFPYIPGLFSFREVPSLVAAFDKLETKPDLIICDGHGIAHPRQVGMATHLGIELDIPTVGCGKSRLVGEWDQSRLGNQRGSTTPLTWKGVQVGTVLRSQEAIKPLFVSIGHKVSLRTAISLTLHMCSAYRLPETTRKADQLVNQLMKEYKT